MVDAKQEAQKLISEVSANSGQVEELFNHIWQSDPDKRTGYERAAHWFVIGWSMANYVSKMPKPQ